MKESAQLPRLFEPISLGGMKLRNRLVMPPMVTNLATGEGYVTEQTIGYYEERAKGGVGLIIVEANCIDSPIGKLASYQLVIDDDRFIEGLSKLARAIKSHGAAAAVQLHHAGGATSARVTGLQPVGPSAVTYPNGETPRELTRSGISEIVQRFANAAGRAKKAGFDGVEIHGAHNYLVSQFLSAAFNQRQDEYGGSLANRARFLLEIVKATRAVVGASYPVWCRLSGKEYGVPGGITIEETQEVARMLEKAGLVALHISAFTTGRDPRHLPAAAQPPGSLVRFAEAVKKVVSIPVITVGRIDPVLGEKILAEGKADLIAIGRGLIADPYLPRKAAEGRLGDIRPCLSCGNCFAHVYAGQEAPLCAVNPAAGKEREYTIQPAPKPRKVAVIGGGPGGMEAARVAALRGHTVTLLEKETQLGGQLNLAAVPPYKAGLNDLTRYLVAQVQKAGVEVELGKKATPAKVKKLAPDAVILATGVSPVLPEIPGIDRSNVVLAEDVLAGRVEVGPRVIVIGGELVGCETAEYLADAGKTVTVTRRGPVMAAGVAPVIGEALVGRLQAKGVTLLPGVKYHEVNAQGLVITTREGEKRTLPADTIVLAAGSKPNTGLLPGLRKGFSEVCQVGDCVEPRGILEALSEGWHAALTL